MKLQIEENKFTYALVKKLVDDCYKVQVNNTDFLRFPELKLNKIKSLKMSLRDKFTLFAREKKVYVDENFLNEATEHLTFIISHTQEFANFYELLSDESSRQLMISLLAFRVIGNKRVKLPLNNSQYWDYVHTIKKKLLKKTHTIPISSLNGYLDYYELQMDNYQLCLNAHSLNILCTFILQQYKYEKEDKLIQVEPGDIVIDAGGCWGDTALYFAHKTGKYGQVFCFEFLPDNLVIMQKNLNFNRDLEDRIKIIPKALWDKSGENISYCEKGPGTCLTPEQTQASQVQTKTIDDFVKEEGLKKLNFIKMDIEGSELKALQGAEQAIRTFRPKLAIALYHKADDFILIPSYLENLKLGYEFFLDHFTIHREETVLFACPTE